ADGATIYNRTASSEPGTSSDLYTAAISITEAVTINAIAAKSGMSNSSVLSLSYTIKPQAAIPTANVTSGAVDPGTLLSLSAADRSEERRVGNGSETRPRRARYTDPSAR